MSKHSEEFVLPRVGACRVIDNFGLLRGRALRVNVRGRPYLEPQQGDKPNDVLEPIASAHTKRLLRRIWWQPVDDVLNNSPGA